MFRKFFSFDGLTNFMLKWIWCGSEGSYENILSDIQLNADHYQLKTKRKTFYY